MASYRVRQATIDDAAAIVGHRIGMFSDMGMAIDVAAVRRAFRGWLETAMPAGTYYAWVVETEAREIVAGGGLTVVPWPPGPWTFGDRLAFIYNVYTEPSHRMRGLARLTMETIHAWCAAEGISMVALNAAPAARHLYKSMGYVMAPSPMMVKNT